MTHQPSLLDEPQRAREEAIERVEANADREWKAAAYWAIEWCAASLPDFTADDVWEALNALIARVGHKPEVSTHEPAALGPVFLRASRNGVIRKTGDFKRSKNPVRHRDLTVWTRT